MSEDLPIPGSPVISTTDPRPSLAATSASRSNPSSPSRSSSVAVSTRPPSLAPTAAPSAKERRAPRTMMRGRAVL
jgi:hypothetical protein